MAEEWVLTPLEITEEKELTPYPAIEYDVVMEASLEKFKRKINQMLEQWRQTEWGISAVSVGNWVRFYQSMVRRNVDLQDNQKENAQHNNITRPENLWNVWQPVWEESEV